MRAPHTWSRASGAPRPAAAASGQVKMTPRTVARERAASQARLLDASIEAFKARLGIMEKESARNAEKDGKPPPRGRDGSAATPALQSASDEQALRPSDLGSSADVTRGGLGPDHVSRTSADSDGTEESATHEMLLARTRELLSDLRASERHKDALVLRWRTNETAGGTPTDGTIKESITRLLAEIEEAEAEQA